jgi:outer membrane protein TolC
MARLAHVARCPAPLAAPTSSAAAAVAVLLLVGSAGAQAPRGEAAPPAPGAPASAAGASSASATAEPRAAAAGAPGRTLADAQRLAQLGAPDVVVSAARASTSSSEVGVAGMLANPRVTLGTATGGYLLSGSLFVSLPLFGQRAAAIDAAEAQARVAAAGIEVARLDARLAVTWAWVALWLVQAESLVARDNAARRARLLEAAQARFTEGAGPRLDVLRATTEARRARAEVAALDEQRGAAAAALAVLLGGNETLAAEASGEPRGIDAVPPLAEAEQLAGEHPVARRARIMLHAADAVVIRERRARWPMVGLQVGGSALNHYPPPSTAFSLALTLELPFFNGALIDRAESGRDTAQTELSAVLLQLRARFAVARAEYLAATRRWDAQAHEVLPAAQEAADLSEEAYRSGGLDLTGTLGAEQALNDARLAALRATAERGRALATLEHAAGKSL